MKSHQITADTALGAPVESVVQKVDAARAQTALDVVRRLETSSEPIDMVRRAAPSAGRSL